MADISITVTTVVDAPAHRVFEYCLDPRRVYAGDPLYRVTDATVVAGGTGTHAALAARMVVFTEEVDITYVEAVRDQRIVFEARPRLRVAGRRAGSEVFTWTWTFTPTQAGTIVTVDVENRGGGAWERALDALGTKKAVEKQTTQRLARIKAATESRARTA